MTKEEEQQRLREANDFRYLGNGPSATGGATGWYLSPEFYFRCVQCGYLMRADPSTYDDCFCGAMRKDPDAGRFGSCFGDERVEVYQVPPESAE